MMKKTLYILCLFLLGFLIVQETKHIYRSDGNSGRQDNSSRYVPTANFVNKVETENKSAKKIAYLSFDDGPSENTKKILETLQKKNAVATFFLTGREITPEREPIVKQEIKQGNAVGVHTFYHEKNKIYCNADSFFEDYQKTADIIERITGKKPNLHRFPWGSNNRYVCSYVDELHRKLSEMGVKSFDWNVSGEDSIGDVVAQETIFQNVKKDLSRFDKPIILLHDSATMKNTASVLERIIDYIRSEGYEFDTLENREEYMFPESWRK